MLTLWIVENHNMIQYNSAVIKKCRIMLKYVFSYDMLKKTGREDSVMMSAISDCLPCIKGASAASRKPLTQGIQPASWQSSRTRIGCVAEATTYPHKLMKPRIYHMNFRQIKRK